ncbi:MAG: OmpA family protein [Alphaproteobacteria bacterium]|nr:OmpA family protein [Alphaproteobacteria bacterium]
MSRRSSFENQASLWPSFVDVMSNLLILMLFVVVIFMLMNFVSSINSQNSKDDRIVELEKIIEEKDKINKALINNVRGVKQDLEKAKEENSLAKSDMEELYSVLDMAKTDAKKEEVKNEQLSNKVAELNMFILQLEGDIIKKDNQVKALQNSEENLKNTVSKLTGEMQKLNDVFEATNKYISWQKVQIVELGKKLNRALANKTAELFKVRSTFFEELSSAVMGNKNFVMVGDRFVIPSEVFFTAESAEIGENGKEKLKELAKILKDAMKAFPDDIDWILRVDGHTDKNPIKGSKFKSNWELSVARAVSVVNFLISEGIPENRLAATGFGEFHPLDNGNTKEAFRKNRRIEFKLTEK